MTSGLEERTAGMVERLAARLPAGAVVTDPDIMGTFVHDEAEWAPFGRPAAVVRARTTAEVVEVVSACAATGTPLVTRGAGTGLSGGANAVDGCVVLSTELTPSSAAVARNPRMSLGRQPPPYPSPGDRNRRPIRAS